ncbi:MAG: 4Fe-4S dicluster domain-containing protein [Bacteroidota bacterium]
MSQVYKSLSIANPHPPFASTMQKVMAGVGGIGLLIMLIAAFDIQAVLSPTFLIISIALISIGTIGFAHQTFKTKSPGIKNDGVWFSGTMSRGVVGWILGIVLTGFYVILYWYAPILGLGVDGASNSGLVAFFDPLSQAVKGVPASQWFVYGTLYTVAILTFGVRFIWRYRHNRYQVIRTMSVMFFQLFFAFLIPELLEGLNADYSQKWFDKDLKNMWPLDYDFFDSWHIANMSAVGIMGWSFLLFGLAMIFVVSPILTYRYGKRWYCSWVCGCGGLAETAGDPFRHLSDKSLKAWKVERWLIHSVLAFSVIMTIAVVYGYLGHGSQYYITRAMFTWIIVGLLIGKAALITYFMNKNRQSWDDIKKIVLGIAGVIGVVLLINFFSGSGNAFFINNYTFKQIYGFLIGAAFSGVVGVGFYPLMGSRVWCRFGCPMAAILGIQQKLFSRFRITTNGNQCISCGNCSTYCEMGIDVRSYAQRGQDIVRASCVGCGICAAVCPRGVLKLENATADIYEKGLDIRNNHVSLATT